MPGKHIPNLGACSNRAGITIFPKRCFVGMESISLLAGSYRPLSFTDSIVTDVDVLATWGRLEIFSPSTSRYFLMSAVRTFSK